MSDFLFGSTTAGGTLLAWIGAAAQNPVITWPGAIASIGSLAWYCIKAWNDRKRDRLHIELAQLDLEKVKAQESVKVTKLELELEKARVREQALVEKLEELEDDDKQE